MVMPLVFVRCQKFDQMIVPLVPEDLEDCGLLLKLPFTIFLKLLDGNL